MDAELSLYDEDFSVHNFDAERQYILLLVR